MNPPTGARRGCRRCEAASGGVGGERRGAFRRRRSRRLRTTTTTTTRSLTRTWAPRRRGIGLTSSTCPRARTSESGLAVGIGVTVVLVAIVAFMVYRLSEPPPQQTSSTPATPPAQSAGTSQPRMIVIQPPAHKCTTEPEPDSVGVQPDPPPADVHAAPLESRKPFANRNDNAAGAAADASGTDGKAADKPASEPRTRVRRTPVATSQGGAQVPRPAGRGTVFEDYRGALPRHALREGHREILGGVARLALVPPRQGPVRRPATSRRRRSANSTATSPSRATRTTAPNSSNSGPRSRIGRSRRTKCWPRSSPSRKRIPPDLYDAKAVSVLRRSARRGTTGSRSR